MRRVIVGMALACIAALPSPAAAGVFPIGASTDNYELNCAFITDGTNADNGTNQAMTFHGQVTCNPGPIPQMDLNVNIYNERTGTPNNPSPSNTCVSVWVCSVDIQQTRPSTSVYQAWFQASLDIHGTPYHWRTFGSPALDVGRLVACLGLERGLCTVNRRS